MPSRTERDAYYRRTVVVQVFAMNMTESNMTKVFERECGPVRNIRFSSPHPKTGGCIITFEKEADAEAALLLGRSRRPVRHPDLDIYWRKGLDISRTCIFPEKENTYTSSPSSSDHAGRTEVRLASFAAETAAEQAAEASEVQRPETEVKAGASDLPPSESTPHSARCLAAEIQGYKYEHKQAILVNDLLRVRVDEVHRRVKSTRASLECQNDMAAVTMERTKQTKAKSDGLRTNIKEAEEEQANLAILREEAEADIKEDSQLEERLAKATANNAMLETLLSKIAQRIDAEEQSRADYALNLTFDKKLKIMAPLINRTFMSDTTVAAFWRVHELVDKCVEEVCSEESALNRVDREEDNNHKRKKQKLDETGRTKICFRLRDP